MTNGNPILIGSTFPLSLIRSQVVIEPRTIRDFRDALHNRTFVSFWGHANTVFVANELLGVDVTSDRPPLCLSPNALPFLDGQEFKECWVLSPDYEPGYRPAPGEEVDIKKITGWQVLCMKWKAEASHLTPGTL